MPKIIKCERCKRLELKINELSEILGLLQLKLNLLKIMK